MSLRWDMAISTDGPRMLPFYDAGVRASRRCIAKSRIGLTCDSKSRTNPHIEQAPFGK